MSLVSNSIFPFRKLPTELKSRILTFLVKIEEADQWVTRTLPNRAISLADVCREWREIIWSTPQMWTTIKLDFWRTDSTEILNLYMKNAKSLPLDITIDFSDHDDAITEASEILPGLASNAKIQSLDLSFEDIYRIGELKYGVRKLLQSNLPRLEKVVLRYVNVDTVEDLFILHQGQMFNNSPTLRDLNIHGVSLEPATMACFTQVTTLNMSALSVEECLNAISYTPNLTHLTLARILKEASSDRFQFHNGPYNFVHHSLKNTDMYADVMSILFRSISCPSLKRLRISLKDTEDENIYLDAATSFLMASNCPLTHLDLKMDGFRSGIWSLFDAVHTTLETLKLRSHHCGDTGEEDVIPLLLEKLTFPSYFPRILKIYIHELDGPFDYSLIYRKLKQRMESWPSGSEFRPSLLKMIVYYESGEYIYSYNSDKFRAKVIDR